MVVIVIEGVDAAGKSEVTRRINEKISDTKILKSSIRDEMMPAVKEVLNKNIDSSVESRFVYFLMLNQMVDNEIKSDPNHYYVKDRSIYSTKAYHTAYNKYYNNGTGLNRIEMLYNAALISAVIPDFAVFLYVDEEERLRRLRRRDSSKNSLTDFETDVMRLVEEEFKKIAKTLIAEGKVKVLEIETTNLTKEQVAEIVINAASSYTPQIKMYK
ncbi:MAG: deoxynucleoside kinase [Candidatus Parvarchaeum sp.]